MLLPRQRVYGGKLVHVELLPPLIDQALRTWDTGIPHPDITERASEATVELFTGSVTCKQMALAFCSSQARGGAEGLLYLGTMDTALKCSLDCPHTRSEAPLSTREC